MSYNNIAFVFLDSKFTQQISSRSEVNSNNMLFSVELIQAKNLISSETLGLKMINYNTKRRSIQLEFLKSKFGINNGLRYNQSEQPVRDEY